MSKRTRNTRAFPLHANEFSAVGDLVLPPNRALLVPHHNAGAHGGGETHRARHAGTGSVDWTEEKWCKEVADMLLKRGKVPDRPLIKRLYMAMLEQSNVTGPSIFDNGLVLAEMLLESQALEAIPPVEKGRRRSESQLLEDELRRLQDKGRL